MKKLTMFVGTGFDRFGGRITRPRWESAMDSTNAYLAGEFGGFTATETFGAWKDYQGSLIEESGLRYEIYVDVREHPKYLDDIREVAATVAREWVQESVLIDWDGHAEFVRFDWEPESIKETEA